MGRRDKFGGPPARDGVHPGVVRRGLTLRRTDGARTPVASSTVAAWEQGTATPRPWWRRPLAAELDGSLEELDDLLATDDEHRPEPETSIPAAAELPTSWPADRADSLAAMLDADGPDLAPGAAARAVHEWLVTDPPQDVELSAGRRVGSTAVERARARAEQLRHLDDYVAGRDLHPAVDREAEATAVLVRSASYTDAVGRGLLAVLAELCQLAGWTNADAGRLKAAERYYVTGLSAAHAAGDRQLAGQLVSSLSYHVANTGRPADAVLLAQSALAGAREATGTARALFGDRLAWAHAQAGDRQETARALGGGLGRRERRLGRWPDPWSACTLQRLVVADQTSTPPHLEMRASTSAIAGSGWSKLPTLHSSTPLSGRWRRPWTFGSSGTIQRPIQRPIQ